MNEESKDEKSVLGKALKVAAVGGITYGVTTGSRRYKEANPEGRKVYGSYKVMSDDVTDATSKIIKTIDSAPSPNLLKEGLNPDALKNQIHLDNLKNGMKDRRVGKKVAEATGKARKTIKRVTKAL